MTRYVRTFIPASLLSLVLLAAGCTAVPMRPPSTAPARARAPAKPAVAVAASPKPGPSPLAPARTLVPPTATPTTHPDSDADQRFNAALGLMKNHQPQEAQAAFLALARDFQGLSGPLTDLGILYAQDHQRPQAIAGLARAVAANPRNAVAWNWLGSLYRENNDYTRAEQSYQQALATRPGYAAAHLNLGILYEVSMNRPRDALNHYREYLKTAGKEDLIVSAWTKELEATAAATTAVASGAAP